MTGGELEMNKKFVKRKTKKNKPIVIYMKTEDLTDPLVCRRIDKAFDIVFGEVLKNKRKKNF